MRIFRILIFPLLFAVPFCAAQSLLEMSGGQTALGGSSEYQKHADLDRFNQAAAQTALPVLQPMPAAQGPSMLSVTRLPDIKLNEAVIKKTVMDYTLAPVVKAAAQAYAGGEADAAKKYKQAMSGDNAQAAGDIAAITLISGDYKIAQRYAAQAAQLDPQNPFYKLQQVWAYAAAGDIKKAKKEYDKLLFLTADFEYISAAKLALGQADFLAGNQKEAMKTLQNLYSSDPYIISHAIYLMGRIAFERGEFKMAQALFEQALMHDRANYMAQKYNARTLEALEDFISAWQTYASIFTLDTKDKEITKKLDMLGKYLKAPPQDYLYYTRVNEIFNKEPSINRSANVRIGLYAQYGGALTEVESFSFLPGASFSIKDEKLGKVITGEALTAKTVIFDKANRGAHIQNRWNTADFSTQRPFVIDLDKEGYTILLRDIKTPHIFAANTGDKELRGSILVIPGEGGMTLINYTTLEDILPSILMSFTRGIKNEAALEAASIALRTRLSAELKNSVDKPFDIADNTPVFNFGGVNMQSPQVRAAVKNTAGIVLSTDAMALAAPEIYRDCSVVSEDGIRNTKENINYVFSPSNLFKFMLSNPPGDLFSAPQDPTLWAPIKWAYSFPAADIAARLAQNHADIGALKSIEFAGLSPSGRALKIRFTGKKGKVELPFKEANFVLAAGTLRSDFFYMVPFSKGGKIVEYLFIGADTGGGKGLCIAGAAGMAREGKTTAEILQYYYPSLKTSKQWTERKSLL